MYSSTGDPSLCVGFSSECADCNQMNILRLYCGQLKCLKVLPYIRTIRITFYIRIHVCFVCSGVLSKHGGAPWPICRREPAPFCRYRRAILRWPKLQQFFVIMHTWKHNYEWYIVFLPIDLPKFYTSNPFNWFTFQTSHFFHCVSYTGPICDKLGAHQEAA